MASHKTKTMNYKLTKTETGNKAGKFHYKVFDEAGNLISERRSNRDYVACTADGGHYFGRLDLIGKGDHGRALKNCDFVFASLSTPEKCAAFDLKEAEARVNPALAPFGMFAAERLEYYKDLFARITAIAYL